MDDPKTQIDQVNEEADRQKQEIVNYETEKIQQEADKQKEEIKNDAQ